MCTVRTLPDAPDVFIDDAKFKDLWLTPDRYYLVASRSQLPRLEKLVGREKLNVVTENGGKFLVTNQPVPGSRLPDMAALERKNQP